MVLQVTSFTEGFSLFVGAIMVLLVGPPVGAVVGSTVLWEAIDRGFDGGLVESGKELTGFIFGRCIPLLGRLTNSCAPPCFRKDPAHASPRCTPHHREKIYSRALAGSTKSW